MREGEEDTKRKRKKARVGGSTRKNPSSLFRDISKHILGEGKKGNLPKRVGTRGSRRKHERGLLKHVTCYVIIIVIILCTTYYVHMCTKKEKKEK